MVYAIVISVKLIIEGLLKSSDFCLVPPSREILEFAYKQVESLQEIARRVVWRSESRLVIEMTDAAQKLEGALMDFSKDVDVQNLMQEVHSFIPRVKIMLETMTEYSEELYNSLPEEEEEDDDNDDDEAVSSRISSGGHKSKMVGLSDLYDEIKRQLTDGTISTAYLSLAGMPGIGKTTLAKEIFEDPDTVKCFDCRVWVTVGRKCPLKEILRRILAQVNPDSNQVLVEGDEDVARYLIESLTGKRYLIVLDDVWDRYIWYHLRTSFRNDELGRYFPNEESGSRVLLTTRLPQVDKFGIRSFHHHFYEMRLLNKEESWDLLHEKVFGEESCPSQLEKAGKKIAEQCDGLPLAIITVADLLSKAEKTPQYWREVVAQKNHQLFRDAHDEISKVLLPSYKYLPRILQMCFLYIGVFPQSYKIPSSKLINMWDVDGFLERNILKFSKHDGMECLKELVSNSLVMIYQSIIGVGAQKQIKTCGLHSSLWYLSNREAGKIKFSHVLSSYDDGLSEGIKRQQRLSFHNNVLFGIKDVYKSVEDNCASTARSLLCYGVYLQYQVPICYGLKLLRELDALTIHFYEFPMEVLQLVRLRYLALTVNGKLPPSIARLSNLHFFIVGRHLSIKSCREPSNYLPLEIWNLKELKHLQVAGRDLPFPCGSSLESLSILTNVSADSCNEGVLKAIPNLEKLGIRIELAPDDDGKPLSCFDHIFHHQRLKSLKFVIENPEVVPALAPLPTFPSNLVKLSLSGLGYPWKELNKIASLRFLSVLKLRNYAFRGPKWEIEEAGFYYLHSLVIEDTDLGEWKIGSGSFMRLTRLCMKHCYLLEKIHGKFGLSLKEIELFACNPLCVEQMKNTVAVKGWTKVDVHSSWDDGNLKT